MIDHVWKEEHYRNGKMVATIYIFGEKPGENIYWTGTSLDSLTDNMAECLRNRDINFANVRKKKDLVFLAGDKKTLVYRRPLERLEFEGLLRGLSANPKIISS